jgi:hypothetical protein
VGPEHLSHPPGQQQQLAAQDPALLHQQQALPSRPPVGQRQLDPRKSRSAGRSNQFTMIAAANRLLQAQASYGRAESGRDSASSRASGADPTLPDAPQASRGGSRSVSDSGSPNSKKVRRRDVRDVP